jgi:mitogen-activated protein kinase 15
LLLNEECHMKVADFGLARSIKALSSAAGTGDTTVLTDYVATRWYRAPEILLGSTCYTKAVDMWSLGCILAEMLCGKPLFPGTSTMNQLEKILEVTGMPPQSDVDAIQSAFAATMLQSLPPVRKRCGSRARGLARRARARRLGRSVRTRSRLKGLPSAGLRARSAPRTPSPLPAPLSSARPRRSLGGSFSASPDAVDLMNRLLEFNPAKRISAEGALKHPYLSQFYTGDEASAPRPVSISIDDNIKYTVQDYRDKLYKEVVTKKRANRKFHALS